MGHQTGGARRDRYRIEETTTTWDRVVVDRSGAIAEWAEAITEIGRATRVEVYAFTNNHYAGHGPETAKQLIEQIEA